MALIFFVEVALLAVVLFFFMAGRATRPPIRWGALWGVALGFWIVAPRLLAVHHFRPSGWRQWAAVDFGLAATYACVGSILAFVICLPLALWRPRRSLPAIVVALLPAAYLGASVLLEWGLVSHAPELAIYAPLIPASLALSAVLGAVTWLATWLLERGGVRAPGWLQAAALTIALAGLIALPFRLPVRANALVAAEALQSRGHETSRAPLLVIGLDSATWRVLDPLIEQGRLPVLADLIRRGVRGDMQALWPPYWSAPAWGAMMTGHTQAEIDVHEDLTASFPVGPSFEVPTTLNPVLDPVFAVEYLLMRMGLLRTALHGRSALHATPVWELLTSAGVQTAVVCFPFTYPAQGQAAVVISRRIATDIWRLAGVTAVDDGRLVSPATDAAKWREWFAAKNPIDLSSLRTILPRLDWPKPRDSVLDPVEQLRLAWDLTMRVFSATGEIIRTHGDLQVVMTYVGSFDTVLHTFWQYRFPGDFPDDPPRREDVDALGGVIDRYAEFVDGRVGYLISRFATAPNVLIVSDHGHGPDRTSSLFRGFHTQTGIFIAAGPDIPHRQDSLTVSYYDVVPTILDLEGFEIPESLSGRSRRERQ